MRKERLKNQDNVFLTSALLLVSAITTAILISRRERRPTGQAKSREPNFPVSYLPGTNPHKSSTFYKLRLEKRQYEILKSYPGNSLVFQFFYPEVSDCGSPTLCAYKMKKYHQATGKPPVFLSYGEASKEPLRGRGQVLGDQQIDINRVEMLIKKVTGSKKGDFSYLNFSPFFLPTNPHVAYAISVDDSSDSVNCDPSPPATAI